jgi:hypothetical protein
MSGYHDTLKLLKKPHQCYMCTTSKTQYNKYHVSKRGDTAPSFLNSIVFWPQREKHLRLMSGLFWTHNTILLGIVVFWTAKAETHKPVVFGFWRHSCRSVV